MRITSICFATLCACLVLSGCGSYLDRFSRQNEGQTNVIIQNASPSSANLTGGVMLYFVRKKLDGTGDDTGRAVGLSNEDFAAGKSIILTNGLYKVYGLGFVGANPLTGPAKCALGNGGNLLSLNGSEVTVSLTFSHATCNFGGASVFSNTDGSTAAANEFDDLYFYFCAAAVSSGDCTTNTGATYSIKYRLLGGFKLAGDNFDIFPSESLTTACSGSAVSGVVSTLGAKIPFGNGEFSPPLEIIIYSDAACATEIARKTLRTGPNDYKNASNGADFISIIPNSGSVSKLKLQYP